MSDDLKAFASLTLMLLANAEDAIDRAEEQVKEATLNPAKIQNQVDEARKHLKLLRQLAKQKIAES